MGIVIIQSRCRADRALLSQALEGYRIIESESDAQTIALIEEGCHEIDLLFLDMTLRGGSGLDVLDYLAKKGLVDAIPVIAIADPGERGGVLDAYEGGADDVITKPFVSEVIKQKCRRLIELFDSRRKVGEELRKRTEELVASQGIDTLTSLMDMEGFLREAEALLLKVEPEARSDYLVCYGNIRNFKVFNSKFGKERGDELLKSFAQILSSNPSNILNARFGQDHLVTLTLNQGIVQDTLRIQKEFNEEYGSYGMQLKTGIYRLRGPQESIYQACELAKAACDSIRDLSETIREYDDAIERELNVSQFVLQNLDRALDNGHIKVYSQPVVRTVSGKTCGMEALARWVDPEVGMISPADFIPVLEQHRLTTKLDMYVLSQVCEGIAQVERIGVPTVPYSINLSRVDFETCDIVGEVDAVVVGAGISRDMINIEVTESAVMEDVEAMKRDIERFRTRGYQVWMDDFGSGYSSLNLLRELEFDEIKLDMGFMANLDAKSREIVTALVSAAKKIGIQTLAEGVETQEQYDFLRDIGCDKVQGYHIAKPIEPMVLRNHPSAQPECVEPRGERGYYDLIGSSVLFTDRPLSIVEFDGEEFSYTYVNGPFKDVWRSIGATDMEGIYHNVNSPTSSLYKQFRDLQKVCHVGNGEHHIVYEVRGQYVRLTAKCLAEHDRREAFKVEIANLSVDDAQETTEKLDKTVRELYALFDAVLSIDLATGKVEALKIGAYKNLSETEALAEMRGAIEDPHFLSRLIHPSERVGFQEFVNVTTLRDRMSREGRSTLTGYFRTLLPNGSYGWKAHFLQLSDDGSRALHCTRYAPLVDDGLLARVEPERREGIADSMAPQMQRALRQALVESRVVNIFWKDTNRRFLGANNCFLDTFGLGSVDEIIGKTDEDMGWHIADEPFAEDERRVIENGEVVTNSHGQCIIKGEVHDIIASKEPLYRDGVISGIIGFFVDADGLGSTGGDYVSATPRDNVTGLMSPQGLIDAIALYADEWTVHQANFAMLNIAVTEYHRIAKTYGDVYAKTVLKMISEAICAVAGNHSVCARLYAGNFVLITGVRDKERAWDLAARIKKELLDIHYVSGYAITLNAEIDIRFADETGRMGAMLDTAGKGALLRGREECSGGRLAGFWSSYEELDEVVYASDVDSHEIVYMNRRAREMYGVSSLEQVQGRKCYELLQGNASPCANCTNQRLLDGESLEWEFFNPQVNRLFRLRDQLVLVDGRRIRIEVAREVAPRTG